MEVIISIIGLMLFSLPLVLVVFAWNFARRSTHAQVAWRKLVFTAALIGSGLGWLWFLIAILVLTRITSSGTYEKIGWISESFSLFFIALSLTGTGVARFLAVLAAAGVALLWVSVGFW